MEVIGILEFNDLDESVTTFGNIHNVAKINITNKIFRKKKIILKTFETGQI